MSNFHVDYHVHYYLDPCAKPEMTLPNIDEYAHKLGLKEIAILKHYSHEMPNHKEKWIYWYRIKESEFLRFLDEVNSYKSKYGIIFRTGVETELINTNGDINIPLWAQEKIDLVALSMHHMIDTKELPIDPSNYPSVCKDDDPWMINWKNTVNQFGPEFFVKSIVKANCNAIKRFPKVRTLSHFYDGLYMLRNYHVPVDNIATDTLLEIMEPLMKTMVEHDVKWELLDHSIPRMEVVNRAKELGVTFVPTADAHSLEGNTWGNFASHPVAQKQLEDLNLPQGFILF